ncbi:hypothetical protein Droror1_Dr00026248 [Drosera rotundifolia]
MVKSYLRYEPAAAFGVIASVDSNITYDSTGRFLLSPALEKVGVWHVRQGICTKRLAPAQACRGPSLAVTSIVSSPTSLVASGYADGSVRIWELESGICQTTLNGHKGAVTALRYNKLGSVLASGSKDNDIILWDVVAEAGLFRLRGHRDQVTDLIFLASDKKLVSSSKDKHLRVWDLETQHCVQIVGGHRSEIWSMDVDPEERYLVTGSGDPALRFYTIIKDDVLDGPAVSAPIGDKISDTGVTSAKSWDVLKEYGEIQRQSKDRVANLRFNTSGGLLACQVAGKTVEVYRVLDEAKSKKKAKRRIHRKKEKKSAKSKGDEMVENGDVNHDADAAEGDIEPSILASDVFKFLQPPLRASKKITSISFCPANARGCLATVALSLNNNSLAIYSIKDNAHEQESGTKQYDIAIEQTLAIDLIGHRSDIRSLSLSPDNSLLMSTSHNATKIWNPSTCSCLRTIDSGYGLCGIFVPNVPGNRYALVGTKEGVIEIMDVGSGTCVETVEAHGGSIHTIAALPDGSGVVTGSADHDVKFWEYQTMQKPGQESKHLTVSNVRTMKMNDDALKVVISPEAKYIAVALLDSTVKVFFLDSLKIFLTLYGHKLPVLCMDISSDGDLIVTGSADKNLKIWGLDFGDCHKSIFAHSDSVMDVKFVPNTHYIFSVGKDRVVKYWDADKFELLLTLEGHHAEVWCLAVSSRGDFIVTGSHDRSIRRWDRTEEPFFIEEEKEKRLEEIFETDLEGYVPQEEIPEQGVVALAGKKTEETLTATDVIIDALDLAEAELKRISEHEEEQQRGKVAAFQPNILMLGLSPSDYVLRAFSNVHASELEQTLLGLPFSDALKLLSYLTGWSSYANQVQLVCRIKTILLQTHNDQLIVTQSARHLLSDLEDAIPAIVKGYKDVIGFNSAAMDHVTQLLASKSDAPFHGAKAMLLEIRAKLAKRTDQRPETMGKKKRKKKQKKADEGHVWS